MDGAANPSQLPPVQNPMGQPPPPPGAYIPGLAPQPQAPQQNGPGRPPGRPNADPDANIDRERKHATRRRLDSILPDEMTDGRIAVYKLLGRSGKVRQSTRPLLTILFKDLEAAAADGIKTGEFVREKIADKFGTEGRFLWLAQDHRGRPLTEYGEVEVNLGADESSLDDPPEDEEQEPVEERFVPPVRDDRVPPPPPPWNPAVYAKEIKETLHQQNDEKQNQTAMMINMMTNSTNLQLQMAREQREADAVRRQDEDRRREREEERNRLREEREEERRREDSRRREKEEEARRDREREDRRAEAAEKAAFLSAMMNRPDVMTPLLIKMVESKGDRDGTKELFAMMGENTRQQMMTQGEATKHLMATQAEAAKGMISNVMDISQKMVQATLEAQQPGDPDDPMDKIGKVFNMLRPVLGSLGGSSAPAPQPALLPPVPPSQAPTRRAAAQPMREANSQIPDAEWTKGCLYTLMRLETGEVPVANRLEALAWVAKNLPPALAGAVKAGDKDQIMALGSAGMDDTLMSWISDENHLKFMERALADVQRMLVRAWDRASAKASVDAHVAYQRSKGVQQEAPPVPEAEVPVEETAQAPAAEESLPKKRSAPLPANMQLAEPLPETPAKPAEG